MSQLLDKKGMILISIKKGGGQTGDELRIKLGGSRWCLYPRGGVNFRIWTMHERIERASERAWVGGRIVVVHWGID